MKIRSLRWGIILLGIGLVFLAINLDYLSYQVWWNLLRLWPVFLIAIGIELIFRHTRVSWLTFLSPLLIAAAFVYAAANDDYDTFNWRYSYHWDDTDYSRDTRRFEFDRDDSLKSLKVDLEFTAGEIWIGPTSQSLFSGDFEYGRSEPTCKFEKDGDAGKIVFRSNEHKNNAYFWTKRMKNDARIFLGDYLPIDLRIKSAAASVDLDLSELIVNKLVIDAGASNVNLKLGCRASEVSVGIDAGASKVNLNIPNDVGLRVQMNTALSSTNLRHLDLTKTGDGYESANFSSAACKAIINLDSGVSKLEIDYY